MTLNEGNVDRTLRMGAGIVLLALAAGHVIGAWGWLGVVPLATGMVGWCPLYRVLGVSTCGLSN